MHAAAAEQELLPGGICGGVVDESGMKLFLIYTCVAAGKPSVKPKQQLSKM